MPRGVSGTPTADASGGWGKPQPTRARYAGARRPAPLAPGGGPAPPPRSGAGTSRGRRAAAGAVAARVTEAMPKPTEVTERPSSMPKSARGNVRRKALALVVAPLSGLQATELPDTMACDSE